MDLSQLNNHDEHSRKSRTQTLEKKKITTSVPAVKSSENPSLPKQLSLQPQQMLASQKGSNTDKSSTSHSETCNNQSSILIDLYQPSNLSNLKIVDDMSAPNSPPGIIEKNVELASFAEATDKSNSPETARTNSTSQCEEETAKEDEQIFKSLSIDSGEHDEVISNGEDEVLEEHHHDEIDLPAGDEETAKGKYQW